MVSRDHASDSRTFGARRWAAAIAAAAALAVSVCAADSAEALPGSLSFGGCIGNLIGCTPTGTPTALDGASAVAVSGDNLYAAGQIGGAISHFKIDANGGLLYQGCIGNNAGPPPCTPTNPVGALVDAESLAVNGSHLYAAAANHVAHLSILPGGGLAFAPSDCYGDDAGCVPVSPFGAVDGASDVAIRGGSLYASASGANAVARFDIQPDGSLVPVDCIGNNPGPPACTATGTPTALNGALDLDLSGSNLYVAGRGGSAVSHLTIGAGGVLNFAGCIGNNPGPPACAPTTPVHALNLVNAVEADGANAYAAGPAGISEFFVFGGGGLALEDCIGPAPGCTPTNPALALDGVLSLVSNGSDLYATVETANDVSHLKIANGGDLSFAGCIGQLTGCTPTVPATAINLPFRPAISGTNLYVPSFSSGNVSQLRIEQLAAPSAGGGAAPIASPTPGPTGQRAAALKRCKKKKRKARKKCRKRALKLPV